MSAQSPLALRAASERDLERILASPTATVTLASIDDRIAGIAVVTATLGVEDATVAELQDLYVLPEHRRQGVATALVMSATAWAREHGCEVVDVVLDPTGAALHGLADFYQRLGFADHGRRLVTLALDARSGSDRA
jgi:GNAT superfamily N-acetyltransferase